MTKPARVTLRLDRGFFLLCAIASALFLLPQLVVPLLLCLLISPFQTDLFLLYVYDTGLWLSVGLIILAVVTGLIEQKVYPLLFWLTVTGLLLIMSGFAAVLRLAL
ncbi:MAG: hypothetical protein Aurels2KO_49230 [Aureliella sp.]